MLPAMNAFRPGDKPRMNRGPLRSRFRMGLDSRDCNVRCARIQRGFSYAITVPARSLESGRRRRGAPRSAGTAWASEPHRRDAAVARVRRSADEGTSRWPTGARGHWSLSVHMPRLVLWARGLGRAACYGRDVNRSSGGRRASEDQQITMPSMISCQSVRGGRPLDFSAHIGRSSL
jgi:hypothetical protein